MWFCFSFGINARRTGTLDQVRREMAESNVLEEHWKLRYDIRQKASVSFVDIYIWHHSIRSIAFDSVSRVVCIAPCDQICIPFPMLL
jgi:hypothetical protein